MAPDFALNHVASARSALDRRSEGEEAQWDTQRAKLEAALNRARK